MSNWANCVGGWLGDYLVMLFHRTIPQEVQQIQIWNSACRYSMVGGWCTFCFENDWGVKMKVATRSDVKTLRPGYLWKYNTSWNFACRYSIVGGWWPSCYLVEGSRSRSLQGHVKKSGTPYLLLGLNYHNQIWVCNRVQSKDDIFTSWKS